MSEKAWTVKRFKIQPPPQKVVITTTIVVKHFDDGTPYRTTAYQIKGNPDLFDPEVIYDILEEAEAAINTKVKEIGWTIKRI